MFKGASNYPIGLDISDLSLKLVQLNKIRDKIIIQAIGKISLPAGLIENGEIKDSNRVTEFIKKLMTNLKYGKVSSEEIIASLPETKTFVKLIEVAKTPNPLSDIMGSEIEKHIPMSADEIYYDWQIIEKNENRQLILAGAAPQNIVNQYTNLIDGAKLSTVALEIEPVTLCRSLLTEESPNYKNTANKNYGIIDIGARRTSMTVYSKNTILFTSSMPISGQEITASIAQTLDLKLIQAEKAKIICGLDSSRAQGVIKNILADMIEELTNKIRDVVDFYNDQYSHRGPINHIILCGGGANIKNLTDILTKKLDIEVKISNPLINLSDEGEEIFKILIEKHSLETNLIKKNQKNNTAKTLSITQNASLNFSTAIGLALRGIFVDKI